MELDLEHSSMLSVSFTDALQMCLLLPVMLLLLLDMQNI